MSAPRVSVKATGRKARAVSKSHVSTVRGVVYVDGVRHVECVGTAEHPGCGALASSHEALAHRASCAWRKSRDAYNADLRARLDRASDLAETQRAEEARRSREHQVSNGSGNTSTNGKGTTEPRAHVVRDEATVAALTKSSDPRERVQAISRADLREQLGKAGVVGAGNLRRPDAVELYVELDADAKAFDKRPARCTASGVLLRGDEAAQTSAPKAKAPAKAAAPTKAPAKKAAPRKAPATKKAPAKRAPRAAAKAPAKRTSAKAPAKAKGTSKAA